MTSIKIVNEYVDLVDIYSSRFLNCEANLMSNTVYGFSDIRTICNFDVQVYNKTAVLIGAYQYALVLFECLACCKSRNGRTEGAYIAYVCNAKAVTDSVLYQFCDIILSVE